jgi:type 1 glutamine amidotransferase
MKKIGIYILLWIALPFGLVAQKQKPMKALVVDGFSNHDWRQTTLVVKRLLEESGLFQVDVATVPVEDSMAFKTWLPHFKKYAVVVQNTNNIQNARLRWPRAAERALEQYVASGGGLLALHSANNAFSQWPEYNKMIGIGWRPKGMGTALEIDSVTKAIIRYAPDEGSGTNHGNRFDAVIHILNRHPINTGYPDKWKTANTEVYNFPRGAAQNITVLSYAFDSSATRRLWPMEWVESYGKGRVYSSSMGHLWQGETYPPAYRCIGFQTTLVRAAEWLATGKVTYPVPANFPTASATSLAAQ